MAEDRNHGLMCTAHSLIIIHMMNKVQWWNMNNNTDIKEFPQNFHFIVFMLFLEKVHFIIFILFLIIV